MQQGPEVEQTGITDQLLLLSRQAAGRMRLGARQSSVKLAFLSRPGATSGATNCQGLLLLGFHGSIMQYRPLTMLVNCDQSALNSAFFSGVGAW
jgi:hypothetical protein